MPRQQAFDSARAVYGDEANLLFSRINDSDDYLALLFRDMNGVLLCAWRFVHTHHEHGPIQVEEA